MKRIVLLFLIMGVVFMSGECVAQPKGDLVICQGGDVSAADNAKHRSTIDINYASQIFDPLCSLDDQGNPQPSLALSHRLIDETTWEFKLRRGVKFHNGTVMTAKDVKFSIDRMTDPKTKAVFAPFYSTIKEAKVVDDSTIQILTKGPDPLLLKRLASFIVIYPSDLFKEKGAESFFEKPVGSGPFKFVSWTRNDRIVLEANEGYWDGSPKVKRVIFRPVPEATTRLAELQTGNADIVTNVPPFLVAQVKGSPNASVQSTPSGRVIFLYINCLAEGPLKNKKVRQALNYAVDRKAIIDNILKGSGIPIALNLTPYHFGYDDSIKPYPYDPAMAKKLLSEAGYPSGLQLVLNTPSGRYTLDKEVSQVIAGMFEDIGIKTDLKVHEWGSYVQLLFAKKLQDISLIGFGNTLHDVDGNFQPLFTPDSGYSYYSNPILTDKINKARTTIDEKARLQIYKEAQKFVFEEAPLVFLYQQIDHYGVSKKLKDFQVREDERLILYKVSK